MKKLLNYFRLSHYEQVGFFILICLLSLMLLAHLFLPYTIKVQAIDYSIVQISSDNDTSVQLNSESTFQKKKITKSVKYFTFDPNTLDLSGWIKLGLSEKQAQVIINYRNKGGKFYEKEDLKKIYSVQNELYDKLMPYIKIEQFSIKQEAAISKKSTTYDIPQKNPINIDLNRADTSTLMELKGIGPVFSRRIVKFRDALGGFVSFEQIKEVYGFPEETYEQILPYLSLNADSVTKLLINTISVNELAKHP